MITLRIAVLVVMFAVTLLALLPLRFAWAAAQPARDLEVASVTGTVWSGELRDVRWRGVELGDLHVTSSLIDRPGDLTLHVKSREGLLKSASVATSSTGSAIENLTIAVELSRLFSGASPGATLRLTDGALALDGAACRTAKGRVTTDEIRTQGLPALEGTIACEKGQLVMSLASFNRAQRLAISIDLALAEPKLVVEDADLVTATWLASMGIPLTTTERSQ
jgi:general secretion pathway protein N